MANRRATAALALVALVGAVLTFYYWVHKPVTPAQALALAQSVANLGVALLLTVTAGGLGRRLLHRFFGPLAEQNLGESSLRIVEVTLGWGVLGLGMLLLGALRLYYPHLLWPLFGVLVVWLRRDLSNWVVATQAMVRGLAPVGRLDRLACTFVILVLGLGFLRALAPPVTWDALVYHLTLPLLYVRTHGIQLNTADFTLFSGMPQATEMLYLAAGLLRLDPAAGAISGQLLGWFFGAALCLGLAAIARDLDLAGWVTPAILFSSLSLALELAWAYADLLLMLFALATWLALRQWRQQRSQLEPARRWLALAATFGGLACGCKYTGIVVPLAGAAVVVIIILRETSGGWRQALMPALGSALWFGLVAGVVFAPWLLKNWLLTGSPVYPLLWPAADMDALRQWFYNRPDLAQPWWQALLIFPRATFLGVQGGNDFDATLGPLLLLCAGLLLFTWRGLSGLLRQELAVLGVFVAAAYLGWVVLAHTSALAHQARLFFAILPALAVLGAAGLRGLRSLNTAALRLSLVVNAAFALVLGLSAVETATVFAAASPLAYLAGQQSASDYAFSQVGWYVPALADINKLPAGSRVVFLWEARSLACSAAVTCVPDVVIDRWWHARRTVGDAAAILRQWRSQGVTDVLLYDAGVRVIQASANNGYDSADWSDLDQMRGALTVVSRYGDAYTLYALP